MEIRPIQRLKAELPILRILSGNVIEDNLLQLSNVLSGILVTSSNKVTDEILEYEKFIQETEFDFTPKIIINGDVATIEHIAVFFHNRFSKCCATIHYNRKVRKIEEFKFESVDIFKFSKHFCF